MANKHRAKGGRGDQPIQLNRSTSGDESSNKSETETKDLLGESFGGSAVRTGKWLPYLRHHWWAVGLIALLSLGVFGAGLKYLDESAKREKAANAGKPLSERQDQSLLSKVNPFVEAPLPSATPQLAREYVYAGGRLLNVIDANAAEVPPADLAVWRPSTGYWYVLGGVQGSQQTYFQWGGTDDEAVPGDYDGDGKTDFAVWRHSNGTWYISTSSSGGASYLAVAFGIGTSGSSDKPVPADYDGDGKTDLAVYRPSTSYWYIKKSSDPNSNVSGYYYGISTDTPAPADYDGDGKADLALWRGDGYTLYLIRSSDNQSQTQAFYAAVPTDKPVSADYDGDGKADFAVRHGSDWLIRYSASSYANATDLTTVAWQAGDYSVPNDYDGDGKVDVAVWNSSNGHWLIRQSAFLSQNNGLREVAWGQSGDTPVPAFYRRQP